MRQQLRAAAALIATVILAGCNSQNSEWSQYYQIVRQALKSGLRPQAVTRDQAAAIPYSSLGYRINGGNEGILVLATDDNGQQVWTAASHIVLTTRGGRIIQTVGLAHNLGATSPTNAGDFPALADALKGPYKSTRIIDLPDINAYSTMLTCTTKQLGSQVITIIGSAISTVRVQETCQSTKPRWSFTNSYWLDSKTGFVWHSIQHVHPSTTLQTEIFRPPG